MPPPEKRRPRRDLFDFFERFPLRLPATMAPPPERRREPRRDFFDFFERLPLRLPPVMADGAANQSNSSCSSEWGSILVDFVFVICGVTIAR